MSDAMHLTSSLPGSTEVGVAGEDDPGLSCSLCARHIAGGTRCDLCDVRASLQARRSRTAKSWS